MADTGLGHRHSHQEREDEETHVEMHRMLARKRKGLRVWNEMRGGIEVHSDFAGSSRNRSQPRSILTRCTIIITWYYGADYRSIRGQRVSGY
jgi:hypothetical protein